MKRPVILFGLLIISFYLAAQDRYQVGLMPSVNFSTGMGKGWKMNLKAESRQRLLQGTFGEESESEYDYILTDFSAIASRKAGLNNSIAGGYLIRFRDTTVTHRLIQQFTVVNRFDNFRLAQRFAADQSFFEGGTMELRLRYRLSAEVPLSGQSVDPGEFYLKFNNEYLNAFYEDDYDLEIRIVPLAGYEFTDNNKLEFGLDYRLSGFVNNSGRHSFWITFNWFIST